MASDHRAILAGADAATMTTGVEDLLRGSRRQEHVAHRTREVESPTGPPEDDS